MAQRPRDDEPVRLEGSEDFTSDDLRVTAGFRTEHAEVPAGGPLYVEFSLRNVGDAPVALAVGTERATLRPSFFSFTVTLEGADEPLRDPAAGAVELGGPGGVLEVAPGAAHREQVLVNEFAALEDVRSRLEPGLRGTLSVRCTRAATWASDQTAVYPVAGGGPQVDVDLVVRVRRNDDALEHLAVRVAADLAADRGAAASAERERAVRLLASLRTPSARGALQALLDHPDPAVRSSAANAIGG